MTNKEYNKFIEKLSDYVIDYLFEELETGGVIIDALQLPDYEEQIKEIMIKDPMCMRVERDIKDRVESLIELGRAHE